ncbi:hypothetical protein RFI_02660, partial [Reticulomyxa filosa]
TNEITKHNWRKKHSQFKQTKSMDINIVFKKMKIIKKHLYSFCCKKILHYFKKHLMSIACYLCYSQEILEKRIQEIIAKKCDSLQYIIINLNSVATAILTSITLEWHPPFFFRNDYFVVFFIINLLFFSLKLIMLALNVERDEKNLEHEKETFSSSGCYDKDWVLLTNKAEKLNPLFCYICKQMANNAVELHCDEHENAGQVYLFGEECLQSYLKQNNGKCPIQQHEYCEFSKSK